MKNTVTLEDVKNVIDTMTFHKMGRKTTVGLATLKNGFEICVSSACVDPENFNEDIGKEICMKRIEDKIWELLGYTLQHSNHLEAISQDTV